MSSCSSASGVLIGSSRILSGSSPVGGIGWYVYVMLIATIGVVITSTHPLLQTANKFVEAPPKGTLTKNMAGLKFSRNPKPVGCPASHGSGFSFSGSQVQRMYSTVNERFQM